MPRPRLLAALAVAAVATAGLPAVAAEPPPPFTTVPLEFDVVVGPEERACTIVGDLRIPAGVTAERPAPGAVLATNGFGGSKDGTGPNGNGSQAARFAEQGYVTLSYSGLGFGGSSCSIYVDDPAYDGEAGSQLISFLGGAEGIATRDGEPFDIAGLVRQDKKGSDGARHEHDPRVGMVGGSYGGQIQFAIASVDPRLDAIAPTYTWNDLGYSLGPNTAGLEGASVRNEVPGIWKAGWHGLFAGLGIAGPVLYPGNEAGACGGYAPWICRAVAEQATLATPSAETLRKIRDVSVGYYADKINIPTLFSQGQRDSLFTINEAVSTFEQLRERGVPTRMVWQSWGHTSGNPVKGELDTGTLEPGSADLRDTYQGRILSDWMAHWIKGEKKDLGPLVRYYRDWAYTAPAGDSKAEALAAATKAYGSSDRYPVGDAARVPLSGTGALVAPGATPEAGSTTFLATGATAGTNTGETVLAGTPPRQVDAPGTSARWTGPVLTAPVDVAGVPELTVTLDAPVHEQLQLVDQGKLQLVARLHDVAPDGTSTVVKELVGAFRVPELREPVRIVMPGVVHRFAPGHRLQVALAASDATYKGFGVPGPVTVQVGPGTGSELLLPLAR